MIRIMLNLKKFRHVWTFSDMFEHVETCFRIVWIVTIYIILNLNKFRHVCLRIIWILTIHIILNLDKFRHVWTCSDIFENHLNCNNSYHIDSEQVYTCLKIIQRNLENLEDLENLKNLDNWVLWIFWELTCRFRSILSSDLGLNSFESCFT